MAGISAESAGTLFDSARERRSAPRPPGGNIPEFTVEQISRAVRQAIEGSFGRIRLRGELSSVSRPNSGHVYLSFKQGRHTLQAVIWRGVFQRIRTDPQTGVEYVATGRLTAYSGSSSYQLTIEELVPAGKGEWLALLEERKAKLQAEGLFDAARKRALPAMPEVIGVVTSPSGAVIRDILHRLRDRFPCHVLVWPASMQGESCASEVEAAIKGFNSAEPESGVPRPDLIIVARGGGSVEDLMGFSEESVVRAAAASAIPLVSAVGHETDTTLIDFASDVRAPTPTAAAEMAVPVRSELLADVASLESRLINAVGRSRSQRAQRLSDLARALPSQDALLAFPRQRVDHGSERLRNSLRSGVQARKLKLADMAGRLRLPPSVHEARRKLDLIAGSLRQAAVSGLDRRKRDLDSVSARTGPQHLLALARRKGTELDSASRRADAACRTRLESLGQSLGAVGRLLESLGYQRTLERGYAVVRAEGKVAVRAENARSADELEIEFQDGKVPVRRSGAGR